MSTFDMNKALTDWSPDEREVIRRAKERIADAKTLLARKPLDVASVGSAAFALRAASEKLDYLATERHMRALRDKDEHDTKAWAAELAAKAAGKGD